MNQSECARREPQVSAQMSLLEMELATYEKTLSVLRERLDIITAPQCTNDRVSDAKSERKEEPLVGLASRIAQARYTLSVLNANLNDLINRVEL